MFGLGKNNEAKVKVKTAKGGGPIRKVKFAIGAGVVASAISPFLTPLLESWLGYVPDGLVEQIARWLVENYELISALIAAYAARPGVDDAVEIEA